MQKQSFNIPKISCGHCVHAIKSELNEMAGIKSVEGDPQNKTVVVEWDAPASVEKIKNKLKEIDYPVA
jgi:copper chaperone